MRICYWLYSLEITIYQYNTFENMGYLNVHHKILVVLTVFQSSKCVSLLSKRPFHFVSNGDSGNDIADMLSKQYLPKDKDLPQAIDQKNVDNHITYLLSKLSDTELIQLINNNPNKNVYNLKDIVEVALSSKSDINVDTRNQQNISVNEKFTDSVMKMHQNNILTHHAIPAKNNQEAFYRLENKEIHSNHPKNKANYYAYQRLNSLLNSRLKQDLYSDEDHKNELLFDVLVAQLKMLCCKTNTETQNNNDDIKSLYEKKPQAFKKVPLFVNENKTKVTNTKEYMFLILNDELKSNDSDELILVDPDSLEKNSSVLLLGPIKTPLADSQLKLVINRISNELSKPEYESLLQQLSDGTINDKGLLKNVIVGPETRRYIKPHRCNHQSPLSKIYGGPKWIICTGYLNLNTPSLYD